MKESLSLDEQFINSIFQKYLKAKVILQNNPIIEEKTEQYARLAVDVDNLSDYQQHLQLVEAILALIPKQESNCLRKDFLDVTSPNSNWWEKHYSQKGYQKLKHKAIKRFLYLFLL